MRHVVSNGGCIHTHSWNDKLSYHLHHLIRPKVTKRVYYTNPNKLILNQNFFRVVKNNNFKCENCVSSKSKKWLTTYYHHLVPFGLLNFFSDKSNMIERLPCHLGVSSK